MSVDILDDLRKLKKGSVLFVEGEPSTYLYIIKNGEITIVREEKNRVIPLAVVGSQQFIGEISIFTDETRTASAIVTSDSEVYLVKKSEIKKVIRSCPEWLSEMMETLCDRLKHASDVLKEHKIVSGVSNLSLTPQQDKEYAEALKKHRSGRGL